VLVPSAPHWFDSKAGHTGSLSSTTNTVLYIPEGASAPAGFQAVANLKHLPVMPHPHPQSKRGSTSRGSTRSRQGSNRSQRSRTSSRPVADTYVCKTRSAGDLLDRALERIGGSLFLNQERLDHFQADGRFDPVFAGKYLPKNWESLTQSRGVERFPRCAVVGNSGHLTLSRYGRVINSFDAVIRTNQAPTKGYGHLVGHKTTFRLINRAMGRRYQDAMESRFRRLRKVKGTIEAASSKYSRLRTRSKIKERLNAGDGTLSRLADNMALKRLGVTEDMLARLHQERGVIKDLKSIMAGVGDSDVKVAAGRFPIEKNVTVILVAEASSTRQEMEQFIRAARAIRPDVKVVIQSGKTRKVFAENLSFCFCEICPRASLTFYLMVAGCGGHACHLDSAPESLLGFGHYKWLKGCRESSNHWHPSHYRNAEAMRQRYFVWFRTSIAGDWKCPLPLLRWSSQSRLQECLYRRTQF